tara:strand:- start:234 stop:431 length:198 start_codon:yes stop_codon:yes gene_type:complete
MVLFNPLFRNIAVDKTTPNKKIIKRIFSVDKESNLNENNKLNPTRGRNNKMRGLLDLNNLTIDKV